MTRLLCLFIISLLFNLSSKAERINIDSALNVLDNVLNNKSFYESRKNKKIKHFRLELNKASSIESKYTLSRILFMQYRTYNLDSALYYAKSTFHFAKEMENPDSINYALMYEADGLKGLGRYDGALEILNQIPRTQVVCSSPYYYHLYHSINNSLFNNTNDANEAQLFYKKTLNYRDTIETINDPKSIGYAINQAEKLKIYGKYNEALLILINFEEINPKEANQNATFLSTKASIYSHLNNKNAQEYFLILASIQDKLVCGKTYTSLQSLALLLYEKGDTERAYRYITYALNDIITSNARSRLIQVAEYMPIITAAHDKQLITEEFRKKMFLGSIVLFAILLGIALIILYKRNRELKTIQLHLDSKNILLNHLNEDLQNLNDRLKESNKIKEEYIAQLFHICSGYMDNIEDYRLSLNKKLKSGKLEELKKELSVPLSTANLKIFLHSFDKIFLDLFPNFISNFNALLRDDEKLVTRDKELLSPELRIFALIRLGINDSIKIADFLHLSTQTVYNYRLKIRNKAKVPKDDFAELISKL